MIPPGDFEDEVQRFRFEIEATEADRLGYSEWFWRELARELRRSKRRLFFLRIASLKDRFTRKVAKAYGSGKRR